MLNKKKELKAIRSFAIYLTFSLNMFRTLNTYIKNVNEDSSCKNHLALINIEITQ